MASSKICDKLLEESAYMALFQCQGCNRTVRIMCSVPLPAPIITCPACDEAMIRRKLPPWEDH